VKDLVKPEDAVFITLELMKIGKGRFIVDYFKSSE